jgi:DNA-binding beta-propeller fold protein YncE
LACAEAGHPGFQYILWRCLRSVRDGFCVAGGVSDNVHIFALGQNGLWAEQAGSPIALGHTAGAGLEVSPCAAGLAITNDGSKLVVANYYNDSINVLTKLASGWAVSAELDLRPGVSDPTASGVPGGEYPFWVVIRGNDSAYVSSIRDREIDVVNISSAPAVMARISLPGQPNKMVLNASQSTLYAAQDNTDSVGVIDTNSNQLVDNIPVTAPSGLLPDRESKFKGNDTNSVTLAKDERSLYVTNAWMNEVAVVQLGPPKQSQVTGLIPTGWYPNSVSFSIDGKFMYVVNDKSPTGPNPGYCHGLTASLSEQCSGSNQYDLQLIKAGLQSFPTPTQGELWRLTQQVADNNHFSRRLSDEEADKLAFLRSHIHHIIYIIKENRTYDQVLGDLDVGNGDPSLTEFGSATTPNLHNLASQFVDLDNFYDTSEVSMDGWPWSTAAHAMDVVEQQTSVEYAGRGLSYDSEGTNRNVNTLLRLPHDHTGNYSIAIAGVNTPELDEADNDYAVGLVVQTIANSQYKDDTLIFVIEDDAQDGGDHVDAHRSIAFVVGPYVKQGAVVSRHYTTLSMFRTIEDILGTGHTNLNDFLAVPMTDVFDTKQPEWTFTAAPSDYLCGTGLQLPACQVAGHRILYPNHDAAYWAKVTKGMDFSMDDKVDGEQFNRILWKGLMGEKPYPSSPSGRDLRANRQQLLEGYRAGLQQQSVPQVESTAASGGGGK